MKEKKSLFAIDVLNNVISVYFSTFFVLYFFQAANYEILPLAKYYIVDYIFTGISYVLIRKAMKKNIKVPYFQIGISLQALYIAFIMLFKENIVHLAILLGLTKGLSNAFYYFPRSIIESEKVNNKDRQHYEGMVSTINQITAIIIPIILGITLTYFSYTDLGKVFFTLFIVIFIIAFNLKDTKPNNNKFDIAGFKKILKKNPNVKMSLSVAFLSGFTYSSGVMILIVTLLKIGMFKTNLNLGLIDGLCAFLCLLVCFFYSKKIKKESFGKILVTTGILSFLSLILLAVFNTEPLLIVYLFIRFTCITMINLVSDTLIMNLSNHKEIKNEYKAEYYCVSEIMYAISRSIGYIILLLVSLLIGSNYISYILIISALALLLEAGMLYALSKKQG